MRAANDTGAGIEPLLEDVLAIVRRETPHLQGMFEIYAQEARFGLAWLAPDLMRLRRGAAILEVGAGLMLLSCHLVSEGYRVTALEPVGEGFAGFQALQKLVLARARERGIEPEILTLPVERLDTQDAYDFAFSVNVMEHVGDVGKALAAVARALRPGARYRFTCANYLFPYEPHFNIPTLFSKSLTARIFGRRIFSNTRVADAQAVWTSLNWITVAQVKHAVKNLPEMSIALDRRMLESSLLRVINDPAFAGRRSPWMRRLVKGVVALGLHRLARWVPPLIQPAMDCSVTRRRPARQ